MEILGREEEKINRGGSHTSVFGVHANKRIECSFIDNVQKDTMNRWQDDCKDNTQWNGICGWERERERDLLSCIDSGGPWKNGLLIFNFKPSFCIYYSDTSSTHGLEWAWEIVHGSLWIPMGTQFQRRDQWSRLNDDHHDNVFIRHHIVNNWKMPNYSTMIHYWVCDLLNLAGFPWSKRSTLIWNDLAQLPINLITFNSSWIASFTGNSGYPNTLALCDAHDTCGHQICRVQH